MSISADNVVSSFYADLKAAYCRFKAVFFIFLILGVSAGLLGAFYYSKPTYRCVALLFFNEPDVVVKRGHSLEDFIRRTDWDFFKMRLTTHAADLLDYTPGLDFDLYAENIGSIRLLKIVVETNNASAAFRLSNAAAALLVPELRTFTGLHYSILPVGKQDAISYKSYYRKAVLMLVGFLFAGISVGLAAVYFLEMFFGGIRSLHKLEKDLNLPILCVLPDFSLSQVNERLFWEGAVKSLQLNVEYLLPAGRAGKILLVSELFLRLRDPQLVCDMAAALASEGKKILIVDANMRRAKGGLGWRNRSGINGFSGILQGCCSLESEISSNFVAEGVDMLACGPALKNPGSMFLRRKMEEFLLECSNLYDYVIIIGAPMQEFTDSLVLGRLADCTLLVCDHGRCNISELKLVLWRLEKAKIVCGGLIVHSFKDRYGSDDCFGYFYNFQR